MIVVTSSGEDAAGLDAVSPQDCPLESDTPAESDVAADMVQSNPQINDSHFDNAVAEQLKIGVTAAYTLWSEERLQLGKDLREKGLTSYNPSNSGNFKKKAKFIENKNDLGLLKPNKTLSSKTESQIEAAYNARSPISASHSLQVIAGFIATWSKLRLFDGKKLQKNALWNESTARLLINHVAERLCIISNLKFAVELHLPLYEWTVEKKGKAKEKKVSGPIDYVFMDKSGQVCGVIEAKAYLGGWNSCEFQKALFQLQLEMTAALRDRSLTFVDDELESVGNPNTPVVRGILTSGRFWYFFTLSWTRFTYHGRIQAKVGVNWVHDVLSVAIFLADYAIR